MIEPGKWYKVKDHPLEGGYGTVVLVATKDYNVYVASVENFKFHNTGNDITDEVVGYYFFDFPPNDFGEGLDND